MSLPPSDQQQVSSVFACGFMILIISGIAWGIFWLVKKQEARQTEIRNYQIQENTAFQSWLRILTINDENFLKQTFVSDNAAIKYIQQIMGFHGYSFGHIFEIVPNLYVDMDYYDASRSRYVIVRLLRRNKYTLVYPMEVQHFIDNRLLSNGCFIGYIFSTSTFSITAMQFASKAKQIELQLVNGKQFSNLYYQGINKQSQQKEEDRQYDKERRSQQKEKRSRQKYSSSSDKQNTSRNVVNYYQLLDLTPSASSELIEKAIHREMRKWSSRTNAPILERRQEAEKRVALLQEAETILLNQSKKEDYDRALEFEY